ncbi:MAG: COX15/CtaA family protein, partial [Sphingobacteriaceae bacterium]
MHSAAEKRFLRVNLLGIISLFLVILAGGVVRSSGSGMGCPDWPKCFDQYVPPTSVSQLPANYQEKYVAGRVAKNERFAKTLDVLGYGDLALRIREDKSILLPEEFNAAKTWTEYINRLIGAIGGLFLLAAVFLSFSYLKTRKRIFFLSLFNVILIGFQAWLGSIVVSTNLLAWVVTVHMLVALAIIAISMYTYFDAKNFHKVSFPVNRNIKILALLVLLLTILQIVLGTEVREQIDAIASLMNNAGRELWVDKADLFKIHRSL